MVGFINEYCHFKISMKLQALFLTDKLHYKSQDNSNIIILIMKLPLSFDSISVPSTWRQVLDDPKDPPQTEYSWQQCFHPLGLTKKYWVKSKFKTRSLKLAQN